VSYEIALSVPDLAPDTADCLAEALAQNWIANVGPSVDAFEQELAECVGSGACLATNSGTAALHLALILSGVAPGDRVFCSTLTFVASANPIRYLGAQPVLIDAEPGTGCMSPSALERALADAARTGTLPRAIIVVHLYGHCADMAEILALAERYGVQVIEDAAQALGSTCHGHAAGSRGHFGVYSFAGNKILTTSTGGALVARDRAAVAQARFLALQARDEAAHYEHSQLGYNYRMSNLLAALGRSQLRCLPDRVAARRAVFERYRAAFAAEPEIGWLDEPAHGRSNRWLSVVLLQAGNPLTPAQLVAALAAQRIEARRLFKPLHRQPLYADAAYHPHASASASDDLFERGVCLPSSSSLSEAQQARVVDAVLSTLHAARRGARPSSTSP
jgi:pyridoxal phosphate-dependent aminotransferase EpsN